MKKLVKKWFKRIIRWAFKDEVDAFIREFGSVSVDVHMKEKSWAVINIGTKGGGCYLKFVDLGQSDLREIQRFLSQFETKQIDASPFDRRFLDFY